MPIISGDSNNNSSITQAGLSRKAQDSSLYTFNTITFTPCGATGRTGPSLSNMQSTYSSYSWASNTSYLNMVGSGIHKWTVPRTGLYRIQAAGAPGGKASDGYGTSSQGNGGGGIIISASFYLTINDILYILVGQHGQDSPTGGTGGSTLEGGNGMNSDTDAGAGGGTFVAKCVTSALSSYYFTPDSSYVIPLIVAGGGGGGSSDGNGGSAIFASTYYNPAAGDQWGYSTGGGWNSYPTDASTGISGLTTRINQGIVGGNPNATSTYGIRGFPRPGSHFLSGGTGGYAPQTTGIEGQGGFGGGGGAVDEGGSGGGGWIGGVSCDNYNPNNAGGCSYIGPEGSSPSNDGYVSQATIGAAGATTNDGYCKITYYGQ
jgi:Glycine rich protein